MEPIFYDGLAGPLRILATVPLLYAAVVLFIRLVGKRATSQMNNFDWIVTVAMGSIVGSAIVLKDVVLLDAVLAIGLLLAIQFGVTWLSVRSDRAEQVVKAFPTLLVYAGRFHEEAMRRERISRQEVWAAVRQSGLTRLEAVGAVVLESDAQLSVIPSSAMQGAAAPPALEGLVGSLQD